MSTVSSGGVKDQLGPINHRLLLHELSKKNVFTKTNITVYLCTFTYVTF